MKRTRHTLLLAIAATAFPLKPCSAQEAQPANASLPQPQVQSDGLLARLKKTPTWFVNQF